MPKIEQLYAFIAADMTPDDEGVVGMQMGPLMMPLVGADIARINSIRQAAQEVANRTGKRLTLVKFSFREELDTVTPEQFQ